MASSVTRETFINAVRDALGFDRGGIDAFLKAINPATSAEDTAKASRPAATGSADGDARDHHGGGSLDAPYTPKVGDVVTIDHGQDYGETRVVTGVVGGTVRYVRLERNGSVICRHETEPSLLAYSRPATPAERIAAGIDQPAPVAPDREGLANALRVAWWGREDDKTTWGATPCDVKADWLRTADAAIRFLNGGSA